MSKVVKLHEAPVELGFITSYLFFSKETVGAKRMALCERNTFPPGNGTPPHAHEENEETFYVIRGKAKVSIGGKEYEIRPGCAVCIPPKTTHNLLSIGEDLLELWVVQAKVS